MIFNSIPFFIYFIIFFFLYWVGFNKQLKQQNIILLLGSYIFYAWADWRFFSFLIGVSALNYFLGIYIGKGTKYKRLLLYVGLIEGIGSLVFLKYFNFFVESFNDVCRILHISLNLQTLHIIIPLGISFFTFRTISYLLDIDKGKINATTDWIVFFNYVSFFPTVLSGPIDRPNTFIPQLQNRRVFEYDGVSEGLKRILWGLFMKVCVADRLSIYTDAVYNNIPHHNGTTLALTALLYPFQMYADFAGYSEMAIGIGKILGFKVMENFKRPFFSQNIAEFWKKWHISLTSWLTDYIFMPLNIKWRNWENWGTIVSIIITFVIIGLWHGSKWTFALFGLYHGLLYIPLILSGAMFKKYKLKMNKFGLPTIKYLGNVIVTFLLVALGLILFKANSVSEAIIVIVKICTKRGALYLDNFTLFVGILSLLILVVKDFVDETGINFNFLNSKYVVVRVLSVVFMISYILLFGVLNGGQFIYFQF